MALKDVKKYFFDVQNQYVEMKSDLKDFEQALADGHITEDKLEEIKDNLYIIEENYQRLAYIMFLMELPNRNKSKNKALSNKKGDGRLNDYFISVGADKKSIKIENECATKRIREEIKRISSEIDKELK